jgi:hypothetical protein
MRFIVAWLHHPPPSILSPLYHRVFVVLFARSAFTLIGLLVVIAGILAAPLLPSNGSALWFGASSGMSRQFFIGHNRCRLPTSIDM